MKNVKGAPVSPLRHSLFEKLRRDPEILTLVDKSDEMLGALGFTDHGRRHVTLVAMIAAKLLHELGFDDHTRDLAQAAALMHDIGNIGGRHDHASRGAALAYPLLAARGVTPADAADIIAAIGNHDEVEEGAPVSAPSAALILADKADIHRSRVRSRDPNAFDIHDEVNFAVVKSELKVDQNAKSIVLQLTTDEAASAADVAELFDARFALCAQAARFLGCSFAVHINGTQVR